VRIATIKVRITGVSPRYAREIMTPEFDCGLDGLLRHREQAVVGILNGVDYTAWDPAHDRHLVAAYSASDLAGKARCRADVRARFKLVDDTRPLLVNVGRLSAQKGIELLVDAMPELATRAVDLIILDSGDSRTESVLHELASRHASWFKLVPGFDDVLAHRLEAAGDLFLMPSLYEPCGLNQLYSLRYGTPPVAHATGGLADTVVDVSPQSLADGSATGFCFAPATSAALVAAIDRALSVYRAERDPTAVCSGSMSTSLPAWRRLQTTGMRQDFSWQHSAHAYAAVYHAPRPLHPSNSELDRATAGLRGQIASQTDLKMRPWRSHRARRVWQLHLHAHQCAPRCPA
jgi:starch synthase